MNKISGKFVAGAALVGMLGLCACKKGDPAVAVVGGRTIGNQEVLEQLATKRQVNVLVVNGVTTVPVPRNQTLSFQSLTDLITRQVIYDWAKREKLYPTDKEVEAELKLRRDVNPDFVAQLQEWGMSLDQIRDELRYDLCRFRLGSRGVKVSDEQIRKRFDETPDMKSKPEQVEFLVIAVTDPPGPKKLADRQKEIDKMLASGRSFREVATQVAEGTGQDALVAARPLNSIPAPIQNALKKIKEGGTTDWVVGPGPSGLAAAKYNLLRRIPAETRDFDKVSKGEIELLVRRPLMTELGQQQNNYERQFLEEIGKAKVEIKSPAMKDQWKELVAEIKRQSGAPAQ